MIIQLEKNIQAAQYQNLTQNLEAINYQYTKVKTQFQEYLVAICYRIAGHSVLKPQHRKFC